MPARQLRLHTTFLKTFLNDLQLFVIRPMTAPNFGTGNDLLAGVGFVAAHDCNRYKSKHHPKRRPSPEAYELNRDKTIDLLARNDRAHGLIGAWAS